MSGAPDVEFGAQGREPVADGVDDVAVLVEVLRGLTEGRPDSQSASGSSIVVPDPASGWQLIARPPCGSAPRDWIRPATARRWRIRRRRGRRSSRCRRDRPRPGSGAEPRGRGESCVRRRNIRARTTFRSGSASSRSRCSAVRTRARCSSSAGRRCSTSQWGRSPVATLRHGLWLRHSRPGSTNAAGCRDRTAGRRSER